MKVEKFASRAFDDLVSAELFALEDSPGNPQESYACLRRSQLEGYNSARKSGYSAAIKAGDAVNIPVGRGPIITAINRAVIHAVAPSRRAPSARQQSIPGEREGQRGVRSDCLLRQLQRLRRRWRDRSAFELGSRGGRIARRRPPPPRASMAA